MMKKIISILDFILILIMIYLLYTKISTYYETYAKFSMNPTIQRYNLYSLFNISIVIEVASFIFYFFNKKTIFYSIVFTIFLVNTIFLIDYYLDNGNNICSCILLFKKFDLIWNLLFYSIVNLTLIVLILKKKLN